MMASRYSCCCKLSVYYRGIFTAEDGSTYYKYGWRSGFYVPPVDIFPDLASFDTANDAISYFNSKNILSLINFQNPNYVGVYEIKVYSNMSHNV